MYFIGVSGQLNINEVLNSVGPLSHASNNYFSLILIMHTYQPTNINLLAMTLILLETKLFCLKRTIIHKRHN